MPLSSYQAPYPLPEKFLICADEESGSYCLVETEFVHKEGYGDRKFWKMRLLSQPAYCVKRGAWREDGLELLPYTYFHERDSRRPGKDKQLFENQIWRTKHYVRLSGMNPLYVYGMTYMNKILPSEFYKVSKGGDPFERWHFKKGEVFPINADQSSFEERHFPARVSGDASAAAACMPPPILKRYFQMIVEKGEECPIMMERLRLETIACGPCGHCFQKEAFVRSVEASGKCPTCRHAMNTREILHL
jgi:hypothetical protein